MHGRIIVFLAPHTPEQRTLIAQTLLRVFGISHVSFGVQTTQDIDTLGTTCIELLRDQEFNTFRISAQRSQKTFPLTSPEIERMVGGAVVSALGKKVNLTFPDSVCTIEIVDQSALVSAQRLEGPGGLPVGSAGPVAVLLSGGIDSPVAAWHLLKRGALPVYIHFHSVPHTSGASLDKARDLVRILSKFHNRPARLILVPFAPLQREILLQCPAKYRVILYRRFMVRIAEAIAREHRALALVTGESLGQVASQTLESIGVIEAATTLPILRPLIGFDKQEIIARAKSIETYQTSILPHEDCCSVFLPPDPETKPKLPFVLDAENSLDVSLLVDRALAQISEEQIEE